MEVSCYLFNTAKKKKKDFNNSLSYFGKKRGSSRCYFQYKTLRCSAVLQLRSVHVEERAGAAVGRVFVDELEVLFFLQWGDHVLSVTAQETNHVKANNNQGRGYSSSQSLFTLK